MFAWKRFLLFLALCIFGAALIVHAGPRRNGGRQVENSVFSDYPLKTVAVLDFEKGSSAVYQAQQQQINDPAQAHSGTGCLYGDVEEPSRATILTIPFQVVEGRPYRIELWVRATNGTRLAVWQVTDGKRTPIGDQNGVPVRWTRYVYDFHGTGTGAGTIMVVGPSSFGGVPGKMWIDDVRLSEVDAPMELSIHITSRVEDYPALVSANSHLYASWLLSENGTDHMQVATLSLSSPGLAGVDRGKPRDVAMPAGAWIAGSALAASGDDAWLAFGAEVNRQWDIYLCRVTPTEVSAPVPVMRDDAVDVRPALCEDGSGRLWIAWESNRGGERAIYAASTNDGKTFTRPERISPAGVNSYNPTMCHAGTQGVLVAYDSFRDSSSEIYLRALQGTQWEPERRLTDSAPINRHPWLAARGDDAWIAWQSCTFDDRTYTMNNAVNQWVYVARIAPDGLYAPAGLNAPWFHSWVSRPTVAIDPQGRVWLAMRRSQGLHDGWEVPLYCYSGGQWSRRVMLSMHGGRMRPAPLAISGGRLVCALQVDDLPQGWSSAPGMGAWHSNIVFPAVDMEKEGPAPSPLQLTRWTPPQTDFNMKAAREERGEDDSRYTTTYEGKQLSVYWGDFHDHSNVSVCNRRMNPSPGDLYDNLRDIARVDFFGATDHGINFDPYLWSWNGKMARMNHDPGRFVAFLAQEWESSFVPNAEHPNDPRALKRYGHRNIFWADPYYPRWFNPKDGSTPSQIWDALGDANYVMIPHQLADTGNCPVDWSYTNEKRQTVAEIYQNRGSYEYLNCPQHAGQAVPAKGYYIQDAWAKGVIIGVIASPDHGGGRGKAAVYASDLSREGILDAVRARHTYGTTGAKIALDVRVNGHLMGEKLPAVRPGDPVTVDVNVIGAADIGTVDICRNNEFIYTRQGNGRRLSFRYRDVAPPDGRLWYYVRVIQSDGEMAWSSPVWLGAT